jgi:predicted Zn-dependent peptidase
MINRNIAPPVKSISDISFINPEEWTLSNGAKVWGIKAGSQDLVKIDFIFNAGSWYQKSNLIAGLTNAFLNQGTKNYTAQQIAETFDFRGAYLQLSADQHYGYVSVLTLNKYLDDILKVTADVIKNPIFPEAELKSQIAKKKQWFIIENNKVKMIAQKKFSQALFGVDYPYANTNKASDYDTLSRELFVQFHKENYNLSNCRILIAGNYSDKTKLLLEDYFGESSVGNKIWTIPEYSINPDKVRTHFVEKADALQSAVRVGRLIINRDHPDFHGLNILVTILGGYFGSRLMSNIREDKGYTYGIGSTIITFPNAAYFFVATETGNEFCRPALNEIYFEMQKLQNEPVGEEELETVKNYLLGETLRSIDGVFALSGTFRSLMEMNNDFSYYSEFINVLNTIQSGDLQKLAEKYFEVHKMFEVVAGKAKP